MIKFETIAGKTFEVQFQKINLIRYMEHCGTPNLPIMNQVALYLNNVHEKKFDVPFDSVKVESIEFNFSRAFRKRYNFINDKLKFNI